MPHANSDEYDIALLIYGNHVGSHGLRQFDVMPWVLTLLPYVDVLIYDDTHTHATQGHSDSISS